MSAPSGALPPKFTTGSTMRHVVVMTATSWIGLLAIFLVDFLNLLYISWLHRPELTAAIGFSGVILFFLMSVGIGTAIGGTMMTARAIGARRTDEARKVATSSLVLSFIAIAVPAVLLMIFARPVLELSGARGGALDNAVTFLIIVLPSMPLMGLGMMLGGLLRSVGDARRSMFVTLAGALSTAILDPIFIFGFGLGITGAAIVTVISRLVFIAVGFHGVLRVHRMLAPLDLAHLRHDAGPLMSIAGPAILTNLATPAGSAITMNVVSSFGDNAVAGSAVIDRLVPLAFGGIFALSGAVGPILGQNLGARLYPRLRQTVTDSTILTVAYCMIVWAVLAIAAPSLVQVFHVEGDGAVALLFFCHWAAGLFVFTGLLFVANAVFNNLGFPVLATVFNWGRSTLGTIPFVVLGAQWYGVIGVTGGWAASGLIFGTAALIVAYRVIDKVAARQPVDRPQPGGH